MSYKADKAKYVKIKRQSCLQKIKTIPFVKGYKSNFTFDLKNRQSA